MTHPHDRALEAAARALKIPATDLPDGHDPYDYLARLAVTAYLDALQETHALVPREATEAMVSVGLNELKQRQHVCTAGTMWAAYCAMIDAAPPAAQDPRP